MPPHRRSRPARGGEAGGEAADHHRPALRRPARRSVRISHRRAGRARAEGAGAGDGDRAEGRRARAAAARDEAALAAVPLLGTAPFELVRTLQSLQDRMAQGDVQAIAAQRALMIQIDKAFMAADAGVWQDNRNAAAAVTYVLSGGPPEILKTLAGARPAAGDRPPAGRRASSTMPAARPMPPRRCSPTSTRPACRRAWRDRSPSPSRRWPCAAIPTKAMQLLAVARLLAPGTLVEEAAIRRQLLVADRQRKRGRGAARWRASISIASATRSMRAISGCASPPRSAT